MLRCAVKDNLALRRAIMKDNTLLKLGGLLAIVLGIAKLLAAALYFVVPPEQRLDVPGAVLLPSVAKDSTMLFAIFWLESLAGILGLAVVPAVTALVRSNNEGWTKWTSTLAKFGFAISAMGYLTTIARLPNIAAAFVKGDPATQAALAVTWKSSPDLFGFWGYGAIGFWILVVSLMALRGTSLPRVLNYVGVLLAIDALLVPVAQLMKSGSLITIIVGASAILVPVWFVWLGLVLRKAEPA